MNKDKVFQPNSYSQSESVIQNKIDDEEILRMAQNIDQDEIYRDVFDLFGIDWELSIPLTLRKMEFVFLETEPID